MSGKEIGQRAGGKSERKDEMNRKKEEWKRGEKTGWLFGWLGGKKSDLTEWFNIQNVSLFLALTVSSVAVERIPDTHEIKIHGKGDLSFLESNVVSLPTLPLPSLAH